MARAHDQPIRITTAAQSRQVDIAHRQRRYVMAMGIRTLCFIGAVIAGVNHVVWLWPVLILAAIFLPYIAVVMANAANTKGATEMDLLDTPYHANELHNDPEPHREDRG
ncbi:DUF3099 domain-containing protein [Nocardioides sp. BP30]|uniref:DUF3099 domain-containing protein n=1 Tax=Nocardioides sp. BP30 TaxID=3036374 RepID=UPI002468A0AD|nr:DUF3099 domain-containing protein [Nocardioides sp. BP30]WGL50869.1 DUF3099 domain-containing protein [Nocardioides sp. BP30]